MGRKLGLEALSIPTLQLDLAKCICPLLFPWLSCYHKVDEGSYLLLYKNTNLTSSWVWNVAVCCTAIGAGLLLTVASMTKPRVVVAGGRLLTLVVWLFDVGWPDSMCISFLADYAEVLSLHLCRSRRAALCSSTPCYTELIVVRILSSQNPLFSLCFQRILLPYSLLFWNADCKGQEVISYNTSYYKLYIYKLYLFIINYIIIIVIYNIILKYEFEKYNNL